MEANQVKALVTTLYTMQRTVWSAYIGAPTGPFDSEAWGDYWTKSTKSVIQTLYNLLQAFLAEQPSPEYKEIIQKMGGSTFQSYVKESLANLDQVIFTLPDAIVRNGNKVALYDIPNAFLSTTALFASIPSGLADNTMSIGCIVGAFPDLAAFSTQVLEDGNNPSSQGVFDTIFNGFIGAMVDPVSPSDHLGNTKNSDPCA